MGGAQWLLGHPARTCPAAGALPGSTPCGVQRRREHILLKRRTQLSASHGGKPAEPLSGLRGRRGRAVKTAETEGEGRSQRRASEVWRNEGQGGGPAVPVKPSPTSNVKSRRKAGKPTGLNPRGRESG